MSQSSSKGFTLVELLIAVMILAGAISGALLLFTSSMLSSEQAWDTTVAVTHGEHILEEMQSKETLASILSTDWNQWAKTQRLSMLPAESIEVLYDNPGQDPLKVSVNIGWIRKARVHNIGLRTRITK